MKKRLWPISAILFALALVAAACGNDDATADASTDETDESSEMEDSMEDMEDMEGTEHSDGGGHDHGSVLDVPDGMAVPQISISAAEDTVSGHNLFIELDDFVIAPENASTDPIDGEGHLHLYVNGERTLRFYNTALQLTDLPEGEHEIMVEVSANNHSAYAVDGAPIRAMTTINVEASEGGHGHAGDDVFESADAPIVGISITEDPKSGWNLFADTGDEFTFTPQNVGGEAVDGEGHLHLSIDGERVTRLYGPYWHISGLSEGEHEIEIEVSGNDHVAYGADGEKIVATATINVSQAQAMLSGGHDDDGMEDGAMEDEAMEDDAMEDGDSNDDEDAHSHGHEGTGEVLDIPAADADVVIEASLAGGDLSLDDRRIAVDTGQTVGILFDADEAEQVHLHGYDILADVGPDTSVDFAFLADSPGTFEVELEGSGRFLFEIQVS